MKRTQKIASEMQQRSRTIETQSLGIELSAAFNEAEQARFMVNRMLNQVANLQTGQFARDKIATKTAI